VKKSVNSPICNSLIYTVRGSRIQSRQPFPPKAEALRDRGGSFRELLLLLVP